MNYEKKYKLLREAVMIRIESNAELKMKAKTEWRKAYLEGAEQSYALLKGYIEQVLEDEGEN